MKGSNSYFRFFSLILMITFSVPTLLNAQLDYWNFMDNHYPVSVVEEAKNGARTLPMWNDDKNYIVTYTEAPVDLTIPQNVNYGYLRLEVRGADGGSRINSALITPFKTKGGGGALIYGYLKIGTGANEVPPGSTVRMIIGQKGGTRDTPEACGSAGGGGTGVFVKKPTEDSWQIIMVAGAGGGAYSDCCTVHSEGRSASMTTSGGDGGGVDHGTGGTNGGNASIGGGGVYKAIVDGVPVGTWDTWTFYDWKAFATQDQLAPFDDNERKSSFGCGNGYKYGAYGGGGGGYSGGGRGGASASGGGGGSYQNGAWVQFGDITILPKTHSPQYGHVVFQLTDDAPKFQQIKFAYNTGKCIDDYASHTTNGTNIQTYNCHSNANQWWFFNPNDRTIRSQLNTNKCLSTKDGTGNNGTNIHLWDCKVNDNQRFLYNGLYKTMHWQVNMNKCWDAANGSAYPTSNVNVQLWDCDLANNNQKWEIGGATTVSNVSNMKYIVPVRAPGFAVLSQSGSQSGSNIMLWTKDNVSTNEQWYFDGLAIKMRGHQNLCIDLDHSNTSNGTNIQLWNCNGTNAQRWFYDGMTQSIRSAVNSNKCMQIMPNSNGAYGKISNVEIHDCNGSDVQQFLIQE